jgi:hypothetical protein
MRISGLAWLVAALNSYGWYQWLYGDQDRAPVFVTRTPRVTGGILAALGVGGIALLGAGTTTPTRMYRTNAGSGAGG